VNRDGLGHCFDAKARIIPLRLRGHDELPGLRRPTRTRWAAAASDLLKCAFEHGVRRSARKQVSLKDNARCASQTESRSSLSSHLNTSGLRFTFDATRKSGKVLDSRFSRDFNPRILAEIELLSVEFRHRRVKLSLLMRTLGNNRSPACESVHLQRKVNVDPLDLAAVSRGKFLDRGLVPGARWAF
jgi:hypothetical protein